MKRSFDNPANLPLNAWKEKENMVMFAVLSDTKIAELRRLVSLAEVVAKRDSTALRLAERDVERMAYEVEALRAKPTPKPAKPKPEPIRMCNKRQYGSEEAAVQACRTLGHTIRAYNCPSCNKWHITKQVYDN